MSRLRAERGVALVTVLLTILLVLAMGLAYVSAARAELTMAKNQARVSAALNLAEAGIHRCMNTLAAEPEWRDGYTDEPLGDGTYTVTVETLAPALVRIISTGRVGNAVRVIEADVETGAGGEESLYSYVMFGKGDVNFRNNTDIVGTIYICGDLAVTGNYLRIRGNIYTTGIISQGRSKITFIQEPGDPVWAIYEHAEVKALDEPPIEFYEANATRIINGAWTFSGENNLDGEYIVVKGGDVRISGTFRGSTVIVTTENVNIVGDVAYSNPTDMLVLVAFKACNINGARVDAWLYTYQDVVVQRDTTVYGGFTGNAQSIQRRLNITYDMRARPPGIPGLPAGGVTLRSWREN